MNSISDLFHKKVLTRRGSLMRGYVNRRYSNVPVPNHSRLGVSIENGGHGTRLKHLKQSNAKIRFISFEPLLGPIGKVDLDGIVWAIVGGESGPRARPMCPDWARQLRDLSPEQNVSFFFKQWGGSRPKSGGGLLDGETWDGFSVERLNGPVANLFVR